MAKGAPPGPRRELASTSPVWRLRGRVACVRLSSGAPAALSRLCVSLQYASVLPMATPTQAGLDQIRLAMASTNDLFNTEVFGRRNFAALDEIYTTDARILPPGSPLISGRPAIRAFWSNLIQAVNAKSAVLTSVDVMPSGNGVVEIGRAKLTVEPEGQGATEMEVKYVVYWRQEDAKWKWHVDIWNQNS
jgi:ketosteroid isomerase-like protein